MANPWLPTWLALVWTAVFTVIVAVHLWHIAVMSGRGRLWHVAHVLSAGGMLVMFMPLDLAVPYRAGTVIFAMSAVIVAGLVVWEAVLRRNISQLWLSTVIDLSAMAYMFEMMSLGVAWLTIPLTGWFLLQVAGWSSGRLYAALAAGSLETPHPTLAAAAPAASTAGLGKIWRPRDGAAVGVGPQPAGLHPVHGPHAGRAHRTTIRVTLALMALGMAYMLLVMHFGMAMMPATAGR